MSHELSDADRLCQSTEEGLKVLQQKIASLSTVINAILPVLNEYSIRLQQERKLRRQSERLVLQTDHLRKCINELEQAFNTHLMTGVVPHGINLNDWKKWLDGESFLVNEFKQLMVHMQFDIDCLKKPKEA